MRDANTAVAYPQITATEAGALEVRGAPVLTRAAEPLSLLEMLSWGSRLFDGQGSQCPVADVLIADLRTGHAGMLPTLVRSALKQTWRGAILDEALVLVQHRRAGRRDLRLIRVYKDRRPRRQPHPDDARLVLLAASRGRRVLDAAQRQFVQLGSAEVFLARTGPNAEQDPDRWGRLSVSAFVGDLRLRPKATWEFALVGDHGEYEAVLTDRTWTFAGRETMLYGLAMAPEEAVHLLALSGYSYDQGQGAWLSPDKPMLYAQIVAAEEGGSRIIFQQRLLQHAS